MHKAFLVLAATLFSTAAVAQTKLPIDALNNIITAASTYTGTCQLINPRPSPPSPVPTGLNQCNSDVQFYVVQQVLRNMDGSIAVKSTAPPWIAIVFTQGEFTYFLTGAPGEREPGVNHVILGHYAFYRTVNALAPDSWRYPENRSDPAWDGECRFEGRADRDPQVESILCYFNSPGPWYWKLYLKDVSKVTVLPIIPAPERPLQ
jgi:hypothetical protein